MRYYSQSQGKIVDTGQQTTNAGEMSGLLNGSGGNPPTQQGRLFGLLSLMKGDYKGAYDFLNPEPDPLIADQQKEQMKANREVSPVLELVRSQEQNFQRAGGGETNIPILSNLLGMQKNISGALNFNKDAKLYNDAKEAFIASVKGLTGDVGVLTEQDAARLAKMFPSFGDAGEVSQRKFQQIRDFISAKYGTKKENTTFKPKEKNIMELLLPQATSIARDVGTGIRWMGTKENLNKQGKLAKILEDRAYSTNDRDLKKTLLQQANNLRTGVSKEAGDISQSFSENVQEDPYSRAIGGASEIGSVYGLPSTAKTITSAPRNIKNLLQGGVFSQGTGQEVRKQAVSVAKDKIDGDRIANHMLEWGARATKANPGETRTVNRIVGEVIDEYAGKKISAKEGSKIWELIDKGFTQQGVTKTATKSQADRALIEVLRQELERVAPGWEQGTKLISRGLRNKNIAKGAARVAATGAVGAGAAAGAGAATYGLFSRLNPQGY